MCKPVEPDVLHQDGMLILSKTSFTTNAASITLLNGILPGSRSITHQSGYWGVVTRLCQGLISMQPRFTIYIRAASFLQTRKKVGSSAESPWRLNVSIHSGTLPCMFFW